MFTLSIIPTIRVAGRTLLAVAGVLALSHGTAWAADPDATHATIDYGQVDFARPDQVASFYRRLRGAADDMCHVESGPRPLAEQVQASSCSDDAVSDAVHQVNRDALTHLDDRAHGRANHSGSQLVEADRQPAPPTSYSR